MTSQTASRPAVLRFLSLYSSPNDVIGHSFEQRWGHEGPWAPLDSDPRFLLTHEQKAVDVARSDPLYDDGRGGIELQIRSTLYGEETPPDDRPGIPRCLIVVNTGTRCHLTRCRTLEDTDSLLAGDTMVLHPGSATEVRVMFPEHEVLAFRVER